MVETITKAELLERMQAAYAHFEALLTPLSEEQMTTAGVNGQWSVKDNLAHLTAWHEYLLGNLRGVVAGRELPSTAPDLPSEDEINEYYYQKYKDLPLSEAQTAFHTSYQRIRETVQSMSDEMLNGPFPNSKSGNPVWPLIVGNTVEHYEEHGATIQNWLRGTEGE